MGRGARGRADGRPLATETDIAHVAAAIGDPSRAAILKALAGGGVLPASALAAEVGVSASTVSAHLAKLREAKLLTVEHDGRHRYRDAGQCSGLEAGGEGRRWEGRQRPGSALTGMVLLLDVVLHHAQRCPADGACEV